MDDVTISKKEYKSLQKQAEAFRLFATHFFETTLGSAQDVAEDFRNTGLYSDEFLHDLEAGLKHSSYATTSYARSVTQKRSAKLSQSA
ncbi:MAG: hypothetical protein COV60_02030 [Candidatus Magasanikbacteria bacterium CG11_big_fil_rev_8_21_14_0_20_43_7]|uniref:Uncharacterized protein n=1 Tax=Candidatus Magasanikbacteria bacterium CG11_big_fil_rev_8_21_14_0_20_43_7 TaxID=1974654 RepID=A0A2H0N2I0_9BACT|nr:MAG: hypothetical protein COV60_02030 [Candidatus Magasanikbacteria bacterium CG11_big_fil_rev_8_21_14_0_20_43_7]